MSTEIYFVGGSPPLLVTADPTEVEEKLARARELRETAHFAEVGNTRTIGIYPEHVAYIGTGI